MFQIWNGELSLRSVLLTLLVLFVVGFLMVATSIVAVHRVVFNLAMLKLGVSWVLSSLLYVQTDLF